MFANPALICVLAKKYAKPKQKKKKKIPVGLAVGFCSFVLFLNSGQLLAGAGACYL